MLADPSSEDGVARHVPPTEKQPEVMLTPLPAVVVAEPRVSDPKLALAAKRFVELAVVAKKFVLVALVRIVLPPNVLLSESSVEDAAVIVIALPTLKAVLLIVPREPVR